MIDALTTHRVKESLVNPASLMSGVGEPSETVPSQEPPPVCTLSQINDVNYTGHSIEASYLHANPTTAPTRYGLLLCIDTFTYHWPPPIIPTPVRPPAMYIYVYEYY